MRFHFVALAILLCLSQPTFAQQTKQIAVENSAKGFDKQFHEILNGYLKAKEQNRDAILSGFAIPAHWFTEMFGDKAAEVASAYAEQFQLFNKANKFRYPFLERCVGCMLQLKTEFVGNLELETPTERTAQYPAPQKFEVEYRLQQMDYIGRHLTSDHGASWVDSFIYIDGAFRFYGLRDTSFLHPFMGPIDPCSSDQHPLGKTVIHRVEPIYPEEAQLKQLIGTVNLLVTVDTDGSVMRVQTIKGDPLLADAAIKAVLQWKYQPARPCGQPTQVSWGEQIEFPPPGNQ